MLSQDDIADIEGDADAIYRMAGLDSAEPASPRDLAMRILGTPPMRASMRGSGELVRVRDEWRIYVARSVAPARARWVANHELAHYYYQRYGYVGADLEQRCDALGAALVAPHRAMQSLRRLYGEDPAAIALKLRTTQSLAFLRLSETRGTPSAVVRRHGAIVRGEPIVWPVPLEFPRVRRLRHPMLRKVRITDETPRVGLRRA